MVKYVIKPSIKDPTVELYLEDNNGVIDLVASNETGRYFVIGIKNGKLIRYGGIDIVGIETDKNGFIIVEDE